MTAAALATWAIEALVASTLLMIVVLALRVPVRRAFGSRVAYALWALPAIRMLLPPLPADWHERAAMPIAAAGEAVGMLILPADAIVAAAPAPTLPWGGIALAAWAIGTLGFFAFHVANHRRFCARLLADARQVDEIDGIRVIESAAAAGPLAFGLRRRFVAFPRDFADRYDADERAFALLHELGHHRARDLLSNWAALAVLALHWFNPVAWHAFRLFRCDQELANDARVLAGRSRTDAHVYACAILKAAHGGHVSVACHLHTIADLKGRMKMLTRRRPSRRRLTAGATAVAAFVAAGLGLTASGTRAAAAVSTRIGDAVGVDLAAQAAPATPPTPLAPAAPPAPTTPPTPATPAGKTGTHRTRHVVVVKDGEARTYTGDEADAYVATHPLPVPPTPPVPPSLAADLLAAAEPLKVLHRTCTDGVDGTPRQIILRREEQGRRVMIVCQNRIDLVARDAARTARESAAYGRATALAGIRSARAGIAADRALGDDQRRNALAGLDKAQAELRASRD